MGKRQTPLTRKRITLLLQIFQEINPFTLSVKEATVKMNERNPQDPVTENVVSKLFSLLNDKEIVEVDAARGRYRRIDLMEKLTDNWALVLKTFKEIGQGTSDDITAKTGELPNRGVHYAISALHKKGLIEKIGKHANGKGIYQVVKSVPVPPPAMAQKGQKDAEAPIPSMDEKSYVELCIVNGKPAARLFGNPSKETIENTYDVISRRSVANV